jgi:hypothetical protein
MTEIALTWDNNKHLFFLTARLDLRSGDGIGRSTVTAQTLAKMYLDTGSNLTSITDTEAERLKIDTHTVETIDVAGIGGVNKTLIVKNLHLFLLDISGNPVEIKLDVAINPASVKRTREKKRGVFTQTNTVSLEMVCLFGLDALIYLKGKIFLDMSKMIGKITI